MRFQKKRILQKMVCKYKDNCNTNKIILIILKIVYAFLFNFATIYYTLNESKAVMLQRIQSVYLFLVFVFAILFAVLPLANFSDDTPLISLRLLNFNAFFSETVFSLSWQGILLIIIWALSLSLTVFMTFQYRNRLFQVKLGKLNILFHVGLILVTFFFIDGLRNQLDGVVINYGAGVLFPVISLIFILMAIKAIKRDEALVRSADRFR